MNKLILITFSLLLASSGLAANLSGAYSCDDGGTLSLTQKGVGAYYASLEYVDGSASTLAEIEFLGESLRGDMYRDDDDGRNMDKITQSNGGNKLVLRFAVDNIVTCMRSF